MSFAMRRVKYLVEKRLLNCMINPEYEFNYTYDAYSRKES